MVLTFRPGNFYQATFQSMKATIIANHDILAARDILTILSNPSFLDKLRMSDLETIMVFCQPMINTELLPAVTTNIRKLLVLAAFHALTQV